ncbi:hypothetical protein R1sor_005020 [Riccia sorocarpa]|uniref:DUF7869 domain-containing protein n=1 Tax=Riccia sorocarpa TaxID=122646 RepID=A0ABD3HPV4_9MARC
MAPASKRLVSKRPVLEELFAEHHDSEKGHYTQARNDGGTNWSDNDNREETASSETRGSKDVEDRDSSEDDMCDVSSPLMRHMSCPVAEEYSPRRQTSYSSSPHGLSKDANRDYRRRGRPTGPLISSTRVLSMPFKSDGLPALQKGKGLRRHHAGSVTSPTKRTKKTSPVKVARLQARFWPLRDQGQPQDKSPTRILTTEVLELSSDDSRKATPPTKFRAKDLRVDVPDDDISWLQRTPLTQNNTSASSPLPVLDLSTITMLGEGNLFLGQTSASPVRPRRLSFSPSSDGSADFFKELSGSHQGSTSAHLSARRDQSETNTNSQGGTTLCSGDLSTTQPQRGPSTEVRRYRETLREDKQSRRMSTPGSGKPNAEAYHLPSNLSKAEVYDYYKTDMRRSRIGDSTKVMSFQSLTLYWRRYYPLVGIPKHNTFTGCDVCEQMKHDRDSDPPGTKKDEAILGLRLHRQQQGEERATGGRHRNKALSCPDEAAYIAIDGMDQNKTRLSHFTKVTKSVDDASLVGVHLVGVMIYHRTFHTKVYATYKNVRSDSNLTISVIHRVVSEWEGPLPATLYIQLDNIVRENKNGIVFAYLAMLVEKKIFRKIKVGFLIVGHTHDHVDQMFSRFSVALRGKKVFTMPQMQQVIQEAYVPSPVFKVLEETWDFKTIVQSRPSPVLPLHDVTFNEQFKIALGGDNWPRLWTKKFSTDETWEPTGGVRHLVLIPDVISDITAAPLVAFKSHSHKRDKTRDLSTDALESFARIKKDIQNVCFSFFSEAERNWWHNWFMRQEIVATDTQAGRQIRLMRQWRWRSPQDEDTSRSKQPPTVITSGDLAQRILGERRPAYASTRRARPGTSEHDRIHHIGDIKDLASGQMVAVLAEDDKSFWISKVIDIKSMTIDGEPNEVEIQWFATESTDPYVGKYYPEKKRDSGRGRATLFRQTLLFPDIRILAFDFSLTTTSRLRKTTISQIRTQLFRLEQEVAVECGVDNANSPEDDDAGPQEQDC